MEVSKVYKWWYNPFLQRTIDSILLKKAAALHHIGKGPDQSRVDHHWRASILESCRDLKITRYSSLCWYMSSDLLFIYMFILFDCNHQGVSRAFVFR